MKKSVFMFMAACCVTLIGTCSACTDKKEDARYFDNLNAMLGTSYSSISLRVTDTVDADTSLKSEFTVKYEENKATITYTVEQFLPLSFDQPNMLKKVSTGSVLLENGTVTQINGEETELPYDAIAGVGLDFKREYFTETEQTSISFKGKVASPSAFLGVDQFTGSEMSVYAAFTDVYQNITVNYTAANGSAVEYKWRFTR